MLIHWKKYCGGGDVREIDYGRCGLVSLVHGHDVHLAHSYQLHGGVVVGKKPCVACVC
jgi:hypothetical protein